MSLNINSHNYGQSLPEKIKFDLRIVHFQFTSAVTSKSSKKNQLEKQECHLLKAYSHTLRMCQKLLVSLKKAKETDIIPK